MNILHAVSVIALFSVIPFLMIQTPEAYSNHDFCYINGAVTKDCHTTNTAPQMSPEFLRDDGESNKAQVTFSNTAHGSPLTVTITLDQAANGTIEFWAQIDDCYLSHSSKPYGTANRCSNSNIATLGGTNSDTETFATYGSTADRDSGTNPTYLPFLFKKITINSGETSGTASWNTSTGSNVTSGESLLVMVSPIIRHTIDNPYLYEWISSNTPRHTTHQSQPYWEASFGATTTPTTVPTISNMRWSTLDPSIVEGTHVNALWDISNGVLTSVTVFVTVSQTGNFLSAADVGNIETSHIGYAVRTVNDNVDEPDGSVTVTIRPHSSYTIVGPSSITIGVTDDDTGGDGLKSGVPIPENPLDEIDPSVIDGARIMAEQTQLGAEHVDRWNRVLAAFGVLEHSNPMTADEAKANIGKYGNAFWGVVAQELEKLEAARDAAQQQPQNSEQPQEPEPVPEPTPTVDPTLIESVKALAGMTHHGEQHVDRWNRVLAAFGVLDHNNPMTAAEAQLNTKRHSSPVWVEVAETLRALEAAQ